jgi:hypothetical protein
MYYQKYIKYKTKYRKLKLQYGGSNGECFEQYDTSMLVDDIKNNFNRIVDDKIIICEDNKIKIKDFETSLYVLINWDKLKRLFKTDLLKTDTMNGTDIMKGVGGLRKAIVNYLINKSPSLIKECYMEFGSTDPTSDLDFTYVTYSHPEVVLKMMIDFYTEFHKIFGNFPDETFDTNFYICTTFVRGDCFSKVTNKKIKDLFIPVGGYQKLYNFNDNIYKKIDRDLAFLVLQEHINGLDTHANKTEKFKKLIQTSKLFYDILINIDKAQIEHNKLLLLLRLLYYLMTAYSNESYISDATYSLIVLKINPDNIEDRYLSFMDNFAYLKEWKLFYEKKEHTSLNLLGFYDAASKYISRCADSLVGTGITVDNAIATDATKWRETIRGKVALTIFSEGTYKEAIEKHPVDADKKSIVEAGYEIKSRRLQKDINSIYDDFEGLYKQIGNKLKPSEGTKNFKATIQQIAFGVPVTLSTSPIEIKVGDYNFDAYLEKIQKAITMIS